MESQFFQFNRFKNLVKREFHGLSRSKYLILSIVAGVVLFMLILNYINSDSSFQVSARADKYVSTTRLLFLLTAILSYKNVNHPQKGFIETMLPASTFEKFLKMQVFSFIILPVGFLLISVSFDMIFSLALSNESFYMILPGIIKSLSKISKVEIWIVMFYAQLLFLLNLFIKSHKLLKTLGFIIISHLGLFILVILVSFTIASNFDGFVGKTNEGVYNIDFDDIIWKSSYYIKVFIGYGVILGLMIGSYFKLKSLRY